MEASAGPRSARRGAGTTAAWRGGLDRHRGEPMFPLTSALARECQKRRTQRQDGFFFAGVAALAKRARKENHVGIRCCASQRLPTAFWGVSFFEGTRQDGFGLPFAFWFPFGNHQGRGTNSKRDRPIQALAQAHVWPLRPLRFQPLRKLNTACLLDTLNIRKVATPF